jgi:hypothetical protein
MHNIYAENYEFTLCNHQKLVKQLLNLIFISSNPNPNQNRNRISNRFDN